MKIFQGIDIVKVERIKESIKRYGGRFIDRTFTKNEKAYCESQRMKYEHYAARFAAKEAFMKAAEIRRASRFSFRRIAVERLPTGKPFIRLTGSARKHFRLPGRFQLELSMAHERDYAIASVVLILP